MIALHRTGAARRAFTLIELIAVMVVLAVLAGVAIPKYFNYADRAKSSALSGAIGGVRTGIANFFADSTFNGDAAYPTLIELTTVGTVMQEEIPANPYNGLSAVQTVTSGQATSRAIVNPTQFGWNYFVDNTVDPPVAVFYANADEETKVDDGSGGFKTANEL
jgi:prepilin-type N-terminal cleavage/methylation domain-containing protein